MRKFYAQVVFTSLTILASICGSSVHADYASEVLVQQPLTYWRFNETGPFTLPDDVATNAGTLGTAGNGSYSAQEAMKGRPGILTNDTAAFCDGANSRDLLVPWSADLNPTGPFSAEGWFKPNATGANLCCFSSGHMATSRSGWLIYQQAAGWNF